MFSIARTGSSIAILLALSTLIMFPLHACAQNNAAAQASFNKNIVPILQKHCAICHMNGRHSGDLYLDTYDSIMEGGDSGSPIVPGDPDHSTLMRAIRYKDDSLQMPPNGKIPDSEIATIEKWIKEIKTDLAPVDSEQPAPSKPEQEKFFTEKVQPILTTRCVGCHGGVAPRSGLNLTSRDSMLKGGKHGPAIVPGDPQNSRIITAVRSTDPEAKMPPHVSLASEQISDLEEWIRQGAPWPTK